VDVINDFSGAGDDGDKIDLTALDLTAGGTVDAIIDGFVFTDLAGTSLYVDLDGGGAGDGAADDVLIAFSADFGTINVNSDVLI